MNFSPDQTTALEKVVAWHGNTTPGEPSFFSLLGAAGTGKTSCAKHIAECVGGTVYFLAFTGKAALVLRNAGCPNAATIHSMIYSPQERSKTRLAALELELSQLPDDAPMNIVEDILQQLAMEKANASRPMFKLKSDSPIRYASLVIVDECSMINEELGKDLMSFGVPVLALGDPGQLPPIGGAAYFCKRQPDYLLTEIHRQAKDSPIIQMATTVRTGGKLHLGDYGRDCKVVVAATEEMALSADQIIVGKNSTRRQCNNWVRKLMGRSGDPVVGDKLVCLRNNADLGLLNGSLWTVIDVNCSEDVAWLLLHPFGDPEGEEVACTAHMHAFQGREDDLPWYEKKEAQEFDFGYAITAHKSQGSQWDSVLIKDESHVFGNNARRHLYTAITRAAKKVIVVQ